MFIEVCDGAHKYLPEFLAVLRQTAGQIQSFTSTIAPFVAKLLPVAAAHPSSLKHGW